MNLRKALLSVGTLLIAAGSSVAFASEEAAATAAAHPGASLGAALAIGLAALGGSLGQAKVGAAALEGIARNPSAQDKIFVPMVIGLALIESLVIYALIIAFMKY